MTPEHEKQFRAGISLINTATHMEESLREFRSCVVMSPRLIAEHGRFTPSKRIVPVQYISERVDKAIELMKDVNHVVEQVFIRKRGKDAITNMSYELASNVDDLYCLSTDDQIKVFEMIASLKNKEVEFIK